MANSDKNILITPNIGSSSDPKIEFKGADSSTGPSTITASVYPTNNGTLSFDGSAGQLFSITNNLTSGSIFAVNDVSGLPSIDVNADGTILLGAYGGNIGVGTISAPSKLTVQGQIQSTQANSTATGGGQIFLNGATGNRIDFGAVGGAAPATTTRSVGTKIVLYPNVSPTLVDYAFGIDSSTLWSSVPDSSAQFKWYAATTNIATLSGAGALSVTGTVSGTQLISTIATGTAPLSVTSTTVVPNLNVSYLQGYQTATANTASTIVLRDGSGDFSARYASLTYVNTSDDVSAGTLTYLMGKFGDNYFRSATAAKVATFISGQTMNISGSSTSCTGNAATVTGFKNIGSIEIQAVSGSSVSCTTAQFLTWYQTNYAFKSYYYTVAKCTWSYAGNNDISDTSIGACEMAGSVIETFSDGTYYTIRITRPTTGAGGFVTLVYNDQGSGYSPSWRTDISSINYNNFSPTLTGTGASGSWGISVTGSSASCTGNAATVTNGFYTTSSFNLGTTSIAVNRASATQSLTGINIDGSSGSCTGNAGTATSFSTNRTNYAGVTDGSVAGQLMWKNYGNNHTIFDASAGTSPAGGAVDRFTPANLVENATSTNSWGYSPNLMGWNGSSTYGVRVDYARLATNISGGTVVATTGSFNGQITSTVATGTAPLSITSTTLVSNLNVQYLNGLSSTQFVRSDADTTLSGLYTFTNTSGSPKLVMSGHSGAANYNYFLNASNDTGVKAVHFVNGSTRSADGGANAYTIRNDGGPFILGNTSYTTTINGSTVTTPNQFILTQANSTTTGGGQIYLNGATGNRIDFNTNGIAAPAIVGATGSTRSVGTKIILYPTGSPTTEVDAAFGIESNTLWSSVWGTSYQFKWYAGTTNIATLSGTGVHSIYTDGSTLYGPNTNWGAYLRVGGNGNADTTNASVVTTNGNLHLDAASGGSATYLNYYKGTGGINFGNGAGATVGSISSSGNLSVNGTVTGTQLISNIASGTVPLTVTSTTTVPNLSVERISDVTGTGSALRITSPRGASFATSTGTITGAIKIKLPTATFKSNTMMRMTVKIYEYSGTASGTSRSIDVGGYNYSDAAANWYNYFATQTTMGGGDINVRFGNDGTSQCIWIGETTTVWNYIQIFVTDFQAGYGNYTDALWGSGWTVSIPAAFDTVTQGPIIAAKNLTSQNYNSYAPTLTGTGASGSWGISVTGSSASCTGNAATATTATNQSGGTVAATTGSFSGQIQSTQANSTTTGGGQIYLNGATGNRIDFNTNGVAAPTLTTRSAGTKIVLYPTATPSTQVDAAFGIDSNTLWSSIWSTSEQFKWYAGTTNIATLSGAGNLSITGIATATQLDLTASASANDSVLYLSGAPTGSSGTNGLLGIGALNFSDTDIIANFTHNVNSYAQLIVQNKNSGSSASSDIIVNNDRTAGTTYYGDFGINGTTFAGGGAFGDVDGTYLYSAGGTLSLGSLNSYDVKIATNNTERVRVSAGGSVGIGTAAPSQTLHVQGNARVTGAVYDSTNSPGTSGQVLQSTVSGTQWTSAAAGVGGGSGKFDTLIDNVLYVQPTGTLDIVGVGTTTTQITTLPTGSNKYLIHSLHVTNVSNGDAEITAGFVMNARKVPASISVSAGSSGGPGIHTFTVGSASSITVGMAVTGTGNIGETTGIGSTAGFQYNTYVTSVDGNTITLSKPMSGYATGVLYFSPVSKVSSRLPVPVGSAVELLKQPMILNSLDSIVLQSTGAGSGIGSTSTSAITQAANSNFLTVTAGAAITNFLASGMLITPTGNNTGIQTNTFVGVGYTPGGLTIPMTKPATVGIASTSLSFTEVVVPEDGALQVTVVYQSSTDTAYLNGTGTVAAASTITSVTAGLSTIPVAYYSTGIVYPSIIQSIRVSNISDGIIYPGGDYPVSVGIGNSDTIFSWLAYNMVIPKNSSIELCEAPKRIGIGQSIFAFSNTPYAIEIQVAGKQKTS